MINAYDIPVPERDFRMKNKLLERRADERVLDQIEKLTIDQMCAYVEPFRYSTFRGHLFPTCGYFNKAHPGDIKYNFFNWLYMAIQFRGYAQRFLVLDGYPDEFDFMMPVINLCKETGLLEPVFMYDRSRGNYVYDGFGRWKPEHISWVSRVNKFGQDICTTEHILMLGSDICLMRYTGADINYIDIAKDLKIGNLYEYDFRIGADFTNEYLKLDPKFGATAQYGDRVCVPHSVGHTEFRILIPDFAMCKRDIIKNYDAMDLQPIHFRAKYNVCHPIKYGACPISDQWERTLTAYANKLAGFYKLDHFVIQGIPY